MLYVSSRCSDYLFKLLLIGDSGVGKSCLLLRFAVSKTFVAFLLVPPPEMQVLPNT